MMKLFCPTLDLFIYDWKRPLNASEADIKTNTQAFRSRIISNPQFKKEKNEPPYQELINSETKTVEFNPHNENLQGYDYPVLLNDTYGLQIDLSVNNETEPQSILQFKCLKEEIDKTEISSTN